MYVYISYIYIYSIYAIGGKEDETGKQLPSLATCMSVCVPTQRREASSDFSSSTSTACCLRV